jgi:hypothetical protein
MLGVLAILVNFGSSFLFSGFETIPLNNSAELNAQGESGCRKGLEGDKKDDGHGYDAHIQNTARSRQAVLLSDSEVSLGESRDAPVDPALEELTLCDEEFMDEESYYQQEEILAIEEEQNLYTQPEQETEITEEEQDALERSIIETSIAVGSLPPDPEEELFCDDEILPEDEATNEGSG